MTTATLAASTRQRDAIEAPPGPLLVLAGPGAGKTFCLIERIRFLIEHHGYDPKRICAVTFTNKAAQEIAERLDKALGAESEGVKGGTLHALCAELLREHGEWVGVRRGFGIADEGYQKDILRRLGVWDKRRSWLLTRFGLHRARGTPLVPEDLDLFAKYQAYLEQRNLLDFDELVGRAARLLEEYDEVAERVAGRWDYLLVDEFQDLNPKQYAVVRRLAERHRNLFAVGDDEQSVYSWTGADPKILQQFANDFRITDRRVMLDENRRTARQIFALARLLVDHNPTLFEKELRAERESAHPVSVLGFPDDGAEARWLLADLVADQRDSGLPWGEYGVLYRRHDIGDLLEAEFLRAGIPCRLASGRALQDDPVVAYLIAALRVIAEPGEVLRQEGFARVVLPSTLWTTIASEAEQRKQPPLDWMRTVARRLDKDDEDAKKLRRADYHLQNLPALARRHDTLAGLVEELLSQRVGTYRTVLEDRHEELTDPGTDPGLVALAERLRGAMEAQRAVRLRRMAGLELVLSGLLRKAGFRHVAYLEPDETPEPTDLELSHDDGGRSGLALGVFKALQLISTHALRDAFRDFVVVDVETTGKDPSNCEIVELGAVRVRDGQIVAEYQQLVSPRGAISPGALETHGISEADLRGQPPLEEVWGAFRDFCGSDILIAHNGNGFDFPILRRLGGPLFEGADFVSYDSLPLARDLHPGSRKLADLAHCFGIELAHAHRAHEDARALAQVFLRLQAEKLARARKTALAHLLDYLGLGFALSEDGSLSEEAERFRRVAAAFALGRYSDCLEHYRRERALPGAEEAPDLDEVIRRLGGRRKLEQYRKLKPAGERYPEAMARLRRLLEGSGGGTLTEHLREFLNRVALSRSDTAEQDPDLPYRVNLLTLHSTKGLEFSRVYIVGAEDGQLPGISRDGRDAPEEELQEARRLLYVGMTRTKDRLVLTRSERRRDLPTGGYRFLKEMGFTLGAPPDAAGPPGSRPRVEPHAGANPMP